MDDWEDLMLLINLILYIVETLQVYIFVMYVTLCDGVSLCFMFYVLCTPAKFYQLFRSLCQKMVGEQAL